MLNQLFGIFIFPGFIFLIVLSQFAEFYDRKLYARFQNRAGPPWFQPWADMIKLFAKEDMVVKGSDVFIFRIMPVFAFAAAVTAYLYIPLWKPSAVFSFSGDIIVVLYFLTVPSLTFFLGGWYSRSIYSMIGAMRSLIQLFAYEVPLFLALLAPTLLANTWSLSELSVFYHQHPWLALVNFPGFLVAMVALLGKLEKVPFDIPEAETEMVAGTFTEYSGKLLAFFRLALNVELVVGVSLIAAVFIPWGHYFPPVIAFIFYIVKIMFLIASVSLARSLFARLRLDQMVEFCWKYLAPLGFLQIIIDLIIKGTL